MKGKLFYSGAMALTLALAGTVSLFSSCSSDDEATQSGGSKELTISVSPSNSLGTRAGIIATDIKDGTENTVNQFVVGIFGSDGNIKGTVQTMSMANNRQLTIDAGDIAEKDNVLVAVNAPKDLFKDVKSEADFRKVTLTLDQALYGNPSHQSTDDNVHTDNNYIPMYGQGTVTKVSDNKFKADIDVYHLVSKVTLASLNVDFSDTYAGATFQPTEIFLANVPDQLGLSLASSSTTYTFLTTETASTLKYVSGETTTDVPSGKDAITPSTYKYLTTGDLTNNTDFPATEANKSKDYDASKLPIFYTMPNGQVGVGKNGATFLVIKGKFTYNGTTDVVYYPIFLNFNTNKQSVVPDNGVAKRVSPNYNYKVKVFITGKGSADPLKPVDGSNATYNITVGNFVDKTQASQDQ